MNKTFVAMKKIILLATLCLCTLVKGQTVNYGTFNIRNSNGDRKDPERCWNERRDRVAQFVLQQRLSIVGMQEVLYDQLTDLQRLLPDYDYEGVGRDDGKRKGEYSPIFWRRADWEKLNGGTFWLSTTPDVVGSVGWDAALTRIATYVLLRHRQTGRPLMCINTHFDHVGHQARQESARLILQKAKEIINAASSLNDQTNNLPNDLPTPFVLTGDFNIAMSDAAYHVITHDATFPILDTYMQGAPHEGPFYTWHDYGRISVDRATKIDYIFASPSIGVLRTSIQQDDRSEHPLHLSDHNPVVATLDLDIAETKINEKKRK